MKTRMMFVLIMMAMVMAAPVSFAQIEFRPMPDFPFCCESPWGDYYPDLFSCMYGCWDGCYVCDLSRFGYDCSGNYGYQYYCSQDNDEKNPSLDVNIDTSCDGNVVTVTSGGKNVANAHVSVKDISSGDLLASGDTDSSGQLKFSGCGMRVDAKATKSGYLSDIATESLESCNGCTPPECTQDSDCPSAERCVENECQPVPCECGKVENHQCVAYACCSDSDCGNGQYCSDHVCKDKESPECTQDADCDSNEYCDAPVGAAGGSCKEVQAGACGEVRDHAFFAYGYECGDEEGCPQCQDGYVCVDHLCVQNDVTCPSTGLVGDMKTCGATENGLPCANCDYVVTDPTGKNSTGQTDDSGNFDLPLNQQGTYQVALLKDGKVVKIIEVKAFPQAQPETPEKPSAAGPDLFSLVWVFGLLLLLFVLLVIYWRGRGKKR